MTAEENAKTAWETYCAANAALEAAEEQLKAAEEARVEAAAAFCRAANARAAATVAANAATVAAAAANGWTHDEEGGVEKTDKPPRCYYCGATHQPEGGPLLHTQVPIVEHGVVARLLQARICDDCAWADDNEPAPDWSFSWDHYTEPKGL